MEVEEFPFGHGMYNFRDGREVITTRYTEAQFASFAPAGFHHMIAWWPDGGWAAVGIRDPPRPFMVFIETILFSAPEHVTRHVSPYVAHCMWRFFTTPTPMLERCLKWTEDLRRMQPNPAIFVDEWIELRIKQLYRLSTQIKGESYKLNQMNRRIWDWSYASGEFVRTMFYSADVLDAVDKLDPKGWHGDEPIWWIQQEDRSLKCPDIWTRARMSIPAILGSIRHKQFILAVATAQPPYVDIAKTYPADASKPLYTSFAELMFNLERFVARINTKEGEPVPEPPDALVLMRQMEDYANIQNDSALAIPRPEITRSRSRDIESFMEPGKQKAREARRESSQRVRAGIANLAGIIGGPMPAPILSERGSDGTGSSRAAPNFINTPVQRISQAPMVESRAVSEREILGWFEPEGAPRDDDPFSNELERFGVGGAVTPDTSRNPRGSRLTLQPSRPDPVSRERSRFGENGREKIRQIPLHDSLPLGHGYSDLGTPPVATPSRRGSLLPPPALNDMVVPDPVPFRVGERLTILNADQRDQLGFTKHAGLLVNQFYPQLLDLTVSHAEDLNAALRVPTALRAFPYDIMDMDTNRHDIEYVMLRLDHYLMMNDVHNGRTKDLGQLAGLFSTMHNIARIMVELPPHRVGIFDKRTEFSRPPREIMEGSIAVLTPFVYLHYFHLDLSDYLPTHVRNVFHQVVDAAARRVSTKLAIGPDRGFWVPTPDPLDIDRHNRLRERAQERINAFYELANRRDSQHLNGDPSGEMMEEPYMPPAGRMSQDRYPPFQRPDEPRINYLGEEYVDMEDDEAIARQLQNQIYNEDPSIERVDIQEERQDYNNNYMNFRNLGDYEVDPPRRPARVNRRNERRTEPEPIRRTEPEPMRLRNRTVDRIIQDHPARRHEFDDEDPIRPQPRDGQMDEEALPANNRRERGVFRGRNQGGDERRQDPVRQVPVQQGPVRQPRIQADNRVRGVGRANVDPRNIVPAYGGDPNIRIPLYGPVHELPDDDNVIFTDVDFINGVARSGNSGMVCVVGRDEDGNDIEVIYREFLDFDNFTNQAVYGYNYANMTVPEREALLDQWLVDTWGWDHIVERTWKMAFRLPHMVRAAVTGNARARIEEGAAHTRIRRGVRQVAGLDAILADNQLWRLVEQLDDQAVSELANLCWGAHMNDIRYFDTMNSRDDLLEYLADSNIPIDRILDGVDAFKDMAAARVQAARSTHIENGRIRRNINESNLQLSKRAPNYYTIKGPPGMGDAPLDYEVPPPAAIKYLSGQFRGIPVSKKIIRESNQFSDLVQGLNDVVDTGLYREKEMLLQYKSSMFYSAWKICKDLLDREERTVTSHFTVQNVQTYVYRGPQVDDDPNAPFPGYRMAPRPSRYIDFTELLGPARGGAFCVPHKLRVTFGRNPPNSSASWGFYIINHLNSLPNTRVLNQRGNAVPVTYQTASYYKIRYGDGVLIPGGLAENHANNFNGATVLPAYHYGAVRPMIKFSKAAKRTQEFEIKPWFGYTDSIYSPLYIPLIGERQQLVATSVYCKTVANGLPISENFTRMSCSLMGAREFSTWNANNETTPWETFNQKATTFLDKLNEYVRDCVVRQACGDGTDVDASKLFLDRFADAAQGIQDWVTLMDQLQDPTAANRQALGAITIANLTNALYPQDYHDEMPGWAFIPAGTRFSRLPLGFQSAGATPHQIFHTFMTLCPYTVLEGVGGWRYSTWQPPVGGRGVGHDACQWTDTVILATSGILGTLTSMKRHLDNLRNFDTFVRSKRHALRGLHADLISAFRQCRSVIAAGFQGVVPLVDLEAILMLPSIEQDDFWDLGATEFVRPLDFNGAAGQERAGIERLALTLIGRRGGLIPARLRAAVSYAPSYLCLQAAPINRAWIHFGGQRASDADAPWRKLVRTLTHCIRDADGNEMGIDVDANRRARTTTVLERPLKVSSNNDDPFNMRVVTNATEMAEYMQERLEYAAEDYKTQINSVGGMRDIMRLPYYNTSQYVLLLPDNVQDGTPITVTYSTFNDHKTYIKYLFLHQYLKVFNYGSKKEVKKIADRRVDTYLTEDIKGIKKLIETFGGDAKTLDRFTKRS